MNEVELGNKQLFVEGPVLRINLNYLPKNIDIPWPDVEILRDMEYASTGGIYEAVRLVERGEIRIRGNLMVRRAKKIKAVLGLRHAIYLSMNQKEIPKECDNCHFTFIGTELVQNGTNRRFYPALRKNNARWELTLTATRGFWYPMDRLIRPVLLYRDTHRNT